MPQRLPIRHLKTFARLHIASLADTEDLAALERHAAPAATSRLDWTRLIVSRAVTITIAREGESLVGAAVVLHRPHAATAKLLWLGVCPSGRGRGVGTLLLATLLSTARDNGAAVVVTETSAGENDALPQLLRAQDFLRRGDDVIARYERPLWEGGAVNTLAGPTLRTHVFVSTARPAATALLAAMASLDPDMLLTPLVEEVVGQEFETALAKDPGRPSTAIATIAGRHRFEARICRRSVLSLSGPSAKPPVTPEQLAECLAAGELPLLALGIARLDGRAQRRWLLVTGFDGERFRLVDPRLAPEIIEVATRSEMRAGIAAPGFEGVILGRHFS